MSTEHIGPKLVSWRTLAASLMTSTGSKIMWQVCVGQRLHAALAAYHITTQNVRIDLAYATDYSPLTMEQDGSTWAIDLNSVTQMKKRPVQGGWG